MVADNDGIINNELFFLPTTKYRILYWNNMKRLSENLELAAMRDAEVILTLL